MSLFIVVIISAAVVEIVYFLESGAAPLSFRQISEHAAHTRFMNKKYKISIVIFSVFLRLHSLSASVAALGFLCVQFLSHVNDNLLRFDDLQMTKQI